jgi:hypothetical protein
MLVNFKSQVCIVCEGISNETPAAKKEEKAEQIYPMQYRASRHIIQGTAPLK